MAYEPIHYNDSNEVEGNQREDGNTNISGWSNLLGDVDDFIFYYAGEYDDGDRGEYRSTR